MSLIEISPTNPERDILNFLNKWFKLLSENEFEEACALLEEPNSYGVVWTADLIKETVNEIFSPDTSFYLNYPEGPIFSDPYKLGNQPKHEAIETYDGYAFDYDVPLNGEWSDLTAQFEFIKKANGYAVVLHDLHVL